MHLENIKLTYGEGMMLIYAIWIFLGLLLGFVGIIYEILRIEIKEIIQKRKDRGE